MGISEQGLFKLCSVRGVIGHVNQTGKNLWHTRSASRIWGAAPMTHMLDGRQYVLIPSGTTLVAFALPDDRP